jgi:mannose-1-phosphate guanylyltransferase
VLVVTNESLVDPIRSQLPQLPRQAVIGEPCKRDTAPAVGLAAAIVARDDGDATMLVMPADHVIQATGKFHQAVEQAAHIVEANPRRFVTFGIKPTYPASSFGYIERGAAFDGENEVGTYRVKMFREKPSLDTAEQYLASGGFYWNAGIFVWKAATILAALAEHEPQMHSHLMTIAEAYGSDRFGEVLATEFGKIQGKSIDYAVMEKYKDVAVIEAPFDWDDVGGWRSLARQHGTDQDGNTVIGRHLSVDSKDCIVRTSADHLVVTLGMQDCIVVHTPDATLVARRQDEESIRRIVTMLQENGWDEYL